MYGFVLTMSVYMLTRVYVCVHIGAQTYLRGNLILPC